jgi:hypothetical protein
MTEIKTRLGTPLPGRTYTVPIKRDPARALPGSRVSNYDPSPEATEKRRAKVVAKFDKHRAAMLTKDEIDRLVENADREKLEILAKVAVSMLTKEQLQREGLL